jgi:prevent-host-death family protein
VTDANRRVGTEEARQNFRAILDDVEHHGEHICVLRHRRPGAVIVPVAWYEHAKEALSRGGEK